MDEAEKIMKRCQAGTRNYEEANNLHAACYGMIGKLLAQTQEPVCPDCKAKVLYECVACSSNNYPPQRTEQEPLIGCVNHDCEKCKAQTEQEPVAWLDGPHLVVRSDMRERLNYKGPWVDLGRAIPDKWTPLLYTTPPQRTWVGSGDLEDSNAYFTQPQRTWVGLTNNELQPIADEYRILFGGWVEDFARAIEAKLKEKNI